MSKTVIFLAVAALIAVLVLAESEAKQPQSKVYMQGPSMAVVPFLCIIACPLSCPAKYVCPGKTPTTNPSTPAGPPADLAAQRAAALANGNAYRATHSAPAQTTDPTLEAEAQAYAEHLASTGTFQHSVPNGAYGENLAKLPSPGTIAQANTAWYGEKPLYCPTGGSVNAASGHFTQMIWKSSTTVAYGSAVGKDGYTYVVARYKPAGNVMGLESANLQC